eukprot:PhF_6_TR942/c0_g1_i2/m.1714
MRKRLRGDEDDGGVRLNLQKCRCSGVLGLVPFPQDIPYITLEDNDLSIAPAYNRTGSWAFLPTSSSSSLLIFNASRNTGFAYSSLDTTTLPRSLTELQLVGNDLVGTVQWNALPPSLEVLNLAFNALSGTIDFMAIPISVWNVTLDRNNFTGKLTCSTCSAIEFLALSYNQLTGTYNAGEFPSLQYLSIGNNKLHGTIAWNLFNRSLLRILADNNDFEGTVNMLLLPPNIIELVISRNNFVGELELRFLSPKLQLLSVGYNHFEGSLPIEAFPPGIQDFSAQHNMFTGTLDLLAKPRRLTVFGVEFNSLCGTIALSPDLPLEKFYLSKNVFHGSIRIPKEWNGTIKYADLTMNEWTGEVVDETKSIEAFPLSCEAKNIGSGVCPDNTFMFNHPTPYQFNAMVNVPLVIPIRPIKPVTSPAVLSVYVKQQAVGSTKCTLDECNVTPSELQWSNSQEAKNITITIRTAQQYTLFVDSQTDEWVGPRQRSLCVIPKRTVSCDFVSPMWHSASGVVLVVNVSYVLICSIDVVPSAVVEGRSLVRFPRVVGVWMDPPIAAWSASIGNDQITQPPAVQRSIIVTATAAFETFTIEYETVLTQAQVPVISEIVAPYWVAVSMSCDMITARVVITIVSSPNMKDKHAMPQYSTTVSCTLFNITQFDFLWTPVNITTYQRNITMVGMKSSSVIRIECGAQGVEFRKDPVQVTSTCAVEKTSTRQDSSKTASVTQELPGVFGIMTTSPSGTTKSFTQSTYSNVMLRHEYCTDGVSRIDFPLYLHPTRLSLGSSPYAQHLGSIVGNIAILFGVILAHYLIGRRMSHVRVGFPQHGLRVEGHFRGHVWGCMMSVVWYDVTDGVWVRVVVMALFVLYVCSVGAYRLYVHRRVHALGVWDRRDGKWVNGHPFTAQHGSVYASVRVPYDWYGDVVCLFDVLMSFVGAIVPTERWHCTSMIVLCMLREFLVISVIGITRPLLLNLRNVVEGSVSVLVFVALAIVLCGASQIALMLLLFASIIAWGLRIYLLGTKIYLKWNKSRSANEIDVK